MDEALRTELLAMAQEDRRVRSKLAADGLLFDGYHPRMQEVHDRNAQRLEEIVSKYGWPGRTLVGDDGAEAAWLIVQHAIGLPSFQRRCLEVLQGSANRNEVPSWQPAYLLDRIRVFEGKPQVYGTQFDRDEQGEMSPCPVEDPASLNERRSAIGLDSIEDRTRMMRDQAKSEPQRSPSDRADHQRKYQEWLKRAGWRDSVH
jgi:hypothetical protein